MKNSFLQMTINTRKIILSSKSLCYKTENFIKKTKYMSSIDMLLSKISETILINSKSILENEKLAVDENACFLVETNDRFFRFYFKLGYQIDNDLNQLDIVFYDCLENKIKLDIRIDEYLKSNTSINIIVSKQSRIVKLEDFNKLYLVSNVSGVNLPKLSREQKEIVNTVDKNVLVQGVAGSGKTNVCIDKIIFTACKNFSGKVLYTTYSRGLLIDTKLKVESYKKDLELVIESYKSGNVEFLDNNHKKALENKLGIFFFSDDDNEIFKKIEKIIDYLSNKVDYLLIEDMYKRKFNDDKVFVGQDYFINTYSSKLENHQIEKCFSKLSYLSKEIIYKEIYGMIFGYSDNTELTLDKYIELRQNSFTKVECENIYQIALDFKKHCNKYNLMDNNIASRLMINKEAHKYDYSLSIIDEVQDYTQINLVLFKSISLKLFCVGDALQMINPSYFNFGYLKNLLYDKDVTDIKELQYNYRNTDKISKIIDSLSEINKQEFGTHKFVIKGKSVDSGVDSITVFVQDGDFTKSITRNSFDNFTFVVANDKDKKELKKIIKNQEVLTVSEIKGLERDTVVVYNILSSNKDKWNTLERQKVSHKLADENSVYRYYYNLFYVGLTRARQNIFVVENFRINQFDKFLRDNFKLLDTTKAIAELDRIVKKVKFTQEEIIERVKEFIKLEQFDNAKFMADNIKEDSVRIDYYRIIEVTKDFIHFGKYREAGIKFWEYGLVDKAKEQFTLSKDNILIELIDRCLDNSSKDLNIDIVKYYDDVKDNIVAQQFIIETIKKDINQLKNSFNVIKENFKKKDKKFGK